ncbi:DEAD/DEAH box helicase [Flavobacterium caeni]|uniref:DEAD/DEAH box helicase n=1 Tax=Flavobacterium caeni TaxID=490189 RepID=A0A1G5AJD5_9FLAO|nr:DEAD/DEAH box helicase [Flavobacterium caeni]SCX77999.1 DEAD/DEAH box helicase [Flavobacterium caeni]
MNLKKINPNLQKALLENDFIVPNEMQEATWSSVKSGADCVVVSPPGSGKTTTLVMHVIQKLQAASGESTRALVFVQDKDQMLEVVNLFKTLGNYTDLRVYGVHEKGDTDFDKNHISLGLDVLVGPPAKLNALFSTAGFNMNTIKIFAVDDADVLFKNRQHAAISRLSDSVEKTQRLFFASAVTEKLELMADKIMVEPLFFEPDEDAS